MRYRKDVCRVVVRSDCMSVGWKTLKVEQDYALGEVEAAYGTQPALGTRRSARAL